MNKENISPPIKCGNCNWLINGLLHVSLLEHSCFRHYDEEKHLLHVDDNNVASIIEKDQSIDIQASNVTDYNEALINAVYARPALYNYRIPLKERTSLKKKALWNEVANLMSTMTGTSDVEFVQKRWKQLRDSYIKAKKKEKAYVPSGSPGGGVQNKIVFAFYNQMKFLDDTIEKPCTITSLSTDVECSMQPKSNTTQTILPSQTISTPQTSDSISSDSWVNPICQMMILFHLRHNHQRKKKRKNATIAQTLK
ncbi:uncharacterized protein LOC105204915 [Solenopsis invicta]|uniref:uncharacterized protein LOC105204915 n=1 Tax=Solenopsis invicta TaxID=13686 RepID=UPI00193D0F6C|nr:uncharacterized protein LOC105204915 [Solenopsis invicta]